MSVPPVMSSVIVPSGPRGMGTRPTSAPRTIASANPARLNGTDADDSAPLVRVWTHEFVVLAPLGGHVDVGELGDELGEENHHDHPDRIGDGVAGRHGLL